MSDKYILDENGDPKPASLMQWAKWYETNQKGRIVAQEHVGDVFISTVFLALNHNWGDGPPILWETMIFGGINDEYQMRYSSKEAAIDGHYNAVKAVKEGIKL